MWAAEEGHVEVVNALLAAGANPNTQAHVSPLTKRKNADHPPGGFTALMFAVRNGHEDVVRALVKGGADLKATNGDGVTATSIAIVNDRFLVLTAPEILDELRERAQDPDAYVVRRSENVG